jgi:hypothetical protein
MHMFYYIHTNLYESSCTFIVKNKSILENINLYVSRHHIKMSLLLKNNISYNRLARNNYFCNYLNKMTSLLIMNYQFYIRKVLIK